MYLAKPSTNIDNSAPVGKDRQMDATKRNKVIGKTVQAGELGHTHRHTNKHTDATKRIIAPALQLIMKQETKSVNYFVKFCKHWPTSN